MKKVHLSLHKFVSRRIQFVENRRSRLSPEFGPGKMCWPGFHHGLGCHSSIQGQGGYDTLTTVIVTIRFHIIKSSLVMTNMSTMRAAATIMMRMTRMRMRVMRMMRKMMMRTRTSRWMRWYRHASLSTWWFIHPLTNVTRKLQRTSTIRTYQNHKMRIKTWHQIVLTQKVTEHGS